MIGTSRKGLKILLAVLLVGLPPCFFYGILFAKVIRLPIEDDYEALLDFLNRITQAPGLHAKASFFLASQFNDYKLFFGHFIAWMQLLLIGHSAIDVLCAIGNGFVLLLAVVLWCMFETGRRITERLLLFIPISLMLFQLCYAETLNWAMPSLQNIPVIVFSLATIYLLVEDRTPVALVCFVLAIGSSGNAMLLIPIGALILIAARKWGRLAVWTATSALCVTAYFYRYTSQSAHKSVIATVIHAHPLYAFALTGSVAASPFEWFGHRAAMAASIVLGLTIWMFFLQMFRKRYLHKNQAAGYCILFLLLTCVAVSGLRSDFGIEHSIDSRYRIYSVLLLAFVWIEIVENFRLSRPAIVGTCLAAAMFSFSMDYQGWFYLDARARRVLAGMSSFQQGGPGPVLPHVNQGARFDELDASAPVILRRSIELGIYKPN
jgi:hypothetical protein